MSPSQRDRIVTVDDVLREKGCKVIGGVACDLGFAVVYLCRGVVVVRLGELADETVYLVRGSVVGVFEYSVARPDSVGRAVERLRELLAGFWGR